jgi:hypothetical protein
MDPIAFVAALGSNINKILGLEVCAAVKGFMSSVLNLPPSLVLSVKINRSGM